MAEYSYVPLQTVAADDNVLFMNGSRACRKGLVLHRDDSGVFTLRGATNQCRAVYRVQFQANIAVAADGGVVEPISIAIALNGEALGNATAEVTPTTAEVTPTTAESFFSVSVATFIEVPCGCCLTVSVENTSPTSAIDVRNANIIIDRVA